MSLHLHRCTRDEMHSLALMVSACATLRTWDRLDLLVYAESMHALTVKLAARRYTLKSDGNHLTLTDLECLSLSVLLPELTDSMQPYERSLALQLLADIDTRRMAMAAAHHVDGDDTLQLEQ